jgi:hypothetical protein
MGALGVCGAGLLPCEDHTLALPLAAAAFAWGEETADEKSKDLLEPPPDCILCKEGDTDVCGRGREASLAESISTSLERIVGY